MARQAAGTPFQLVGGRLCLDFCNTVSDSGGERVDGISDYVQLVAWSSRAGILNREEAARVRRAARRTPTAALAVLERAHSVREALHEVFVAAANGETLRSRSVDVLNFELGRAMARSQLVADGQGYTWVWDEGGRALDSMLWPVARSAADLLTSGELEAVRLCAGRACGRLFLDTSRNRTRRWCDMRTCGNRAKARRHHARLRSGAA